jgi:hypothetical protein
MGHYTVLHFGLVTPLAWVIRALAPVAQHGAPLELICTHSYVIPGTPQCVSSKMHWINY